MEIRKLNTLRAAAALIVVLSHYSNYTNFLNRIPGKGAGQVGVMLFFILSGFLMSFLYMDREFSRGEVTSFVIARVARVVPLFLVVVLGSYALQLVGITGYFFYIPNQPILWSHLTLFSGSSILWTIPAEIQFYALFVLLWWMMAKREIYLFVFMAGIFLGLLILDFPRPEGRALGMPFDIRLLQSLPYFFVGVVFGQLYGRWKPPDYLSSGFFVLAILGLPLLYPKVFVLLAGYEYRVWQDVGCLFWISSIFFLLVFLVPEKNVLLSNRVGDFLGKISYSWYLLHLPLLRYIKEPAKERPELFLVLFLAVSIGLAYVSYRVIEAPLRKAIRAIAPADRMRVDSVGSPEPR